MPIVGMLFFAGLLACLVAAVVTLILMRRLRELIVQGGNVYNPVLAAMRRDLDTLVAAARDAAEAVPVTPRPARDLIQISLRGTMFTRAQVEAMIEQLSDAARSGAVLNYVGHDAGGSA